MSLIGHQILLVVAVAALGSVGLRLASLASPRGLERVIAAVPLGVAFAVVSAMALGVVALGTSPVALTLVAVAAWLAVRTMVPRPQVRPGVELRQWWLVRSRAEQAAFGAAAGILVIYAAWVVRYPSLGIDGLVYHLTEVVKWVHSGEPGSIVPITYEFPVGNYPLTNEVVLAWLSGISRTLVPMTLWTPATLALLLAAGWLGLRSLEVPRSHVIPALVAVATLPLTVGQLNGPNTDLPALAWLVTAAALVAASPRRPALLVPALVAAGLAIGTKATGAPLLLVLALAGGYVNRRSLRPLAKPLAAAALVAAVVGAFWHLRNLVQHGSPLWPFLAAPWGDPVPPHLAEIDVSLLDRPRATLEGRVDRYLDSLAGGALLLVAGVAAALVARRRAVTAMVAVLVLALLAWANAPFTGIADNTLFDLSLTTVRYLLPAMTVAAVVLALCGRVEGAAWRFGAAGLTAATLWNLARLAQLDFPAVPSVLTVLSGAIAGLGVALLTARAPVRSPLFGRAVAAGGAIATVVLIAAAAPGYLSRHASAAKILEPDMVAWFDSQPAFREGSRPLAMAPTVVGVLAGPRITHELELISAGEPCPRVRERAARGWVVIREHSFAELLTPFTALECMKSERPLLKSGAFRVYGPESPES